MAGDPIDGQVLLLTAAKASVPSTRLPDLVDLAQAELVDRLEAYRRRYECVAETEIDPADGGGDDARPVYAFLAETGHWEELGAELGFDRREVDAVERAHVEQLRRIGRRQERSPEVDAALEIREPVLIAAPVGENGRP